MELNKYFIIFITLISFSKAEITLPEMATKQATNNLRFISKDGRFSYYQRRSGSLLLSTNYNVEEVLKGKEGSQYNIISSSTKKFQIIEQNENFHTYLSVRKLNKIYLTSYGEKKTNFLGEGIDARLHLNDSWVSYFNPYKMTIYFTSLKTLGTSFKIKLQNNKNPYFIPQRVMLNDKIILFSDLNTDAVAGIIEFDRSSAKSNLLLKAENEFSRYELCVNEKSLFLGTFGTRNIAKYSSITKYPIKKFQISKGSIIYDSKYNDRGSIICDSSDKQLYFIKNATKENGEETYEASSINLESKDIKILSSFKWVSSIINMDDKLILPYHGKFFLLNAKKNTLTNDSLLEESKKENAQEVKK